MSGAEEVKMQIKVTINKEKNKVLFAEAGSDFTDVLLSFLLLPLGTIARVLKDHYGDDAPVIGSLSTLYNGMANLDSIHFDEGEKEKLLSPRSYYESKFSSMRLNVSSPDPVSSDSGETYDGVLTRGAGCFIIRDDLQLMPDMAGSVLKTLSDLGITLSDMDEAQTMTVTFGLNEVMVLLNGSFVSENPLSALLFPRSQLSLSTPKYEDGNAPSQRIDETAIASNSKKMILTAMLEKSSNKLLFAQSDYEFVNFLFGLLTLPLGRAEWYFDSNSGLQNIDNLHRSLAAHNFGCNLPCKYQLIKPKCPVSAHYYNDFTPLNFSTNYTRRHVNWSRMYMVSDDLTVSPLGVTSSVSVLKGMNISLSDVEEIELQVWLEEGLSVLKVALTSTTALTDGLINPMLMTKSKQEI